MFAIPQYIGRLRWMRAICDQEPPLGGTAAPHRPPTAGHVGYCLHVSKQGAQAFGEYLANFIAHSGRYPNATAFAIAVGVNPAAVSRWINAKERPAPRSLEKLAPHMGVSVQNLFAIAYPEESADVALPDLPELHPLARDINQILSDDSSIGKDDRDALETYLDVVIDPYRKRLRRRRPA